MLELNKRQSALPACSEGRRVKNLKSRWTSEDETLRKLASKISRQRLTVRLDRMLVLFAPALLSLVSDSTLRLRNNPEQVSRGFREPRLLRRIWIFLGPRGVTTGCLS